MTATSTLRRPTIADPEKSPLPRRSTSAPILSALVLLSAVSYALFATRRLDVLTFIAQGQFDWSSSTTSVPISAASVALKALLSADTASLPPALVAAVPPADTIAVQHVRDWLNEAKFNRLQAICKGARRCHSHRRGKHGTTALHVAAFNGAHSLMSYLSQHGAKPTFDDAYRLPKNLSFTNFMTNARIASTNAGRDCQLPVVKYDGSHAAMTETARLVSEGEPVLLQGALRHIAPQLLDSFSVDTLLHHHGDARVRVGAVPYANAFNLSTSEMTLRDFHTEHMHHDDDSRPPQYVFAKNADVCQNGYTALAKLVVDAFPISKLFAHPDVTGGAKGMHFFLGTRGSGAPFHLHADAINAAISGSKRWFIYTPAKSIYSRVPIKTWVENVLPHLDQSQRPLTCTQRPGDVLYIPLDWGHAVINEDKETFGFALELLNRRDTLMDVVGSGRAVLG